MSSTKKSLDDLINKNRNNQRKIEVIKNNNNFYKNKPRRNFNQNQRQNNNFNRNQRPAFQRRNIRNNFNQRIRTRSNVIIRENRKIFNNNPRLLVSNLNPYIINSDLKTIFEKIGPLKRCGIHWDELGNSKGTADVEFYKPYDASRAIEEYNNAEIEGKPIRVQYGNHGNSINKVMPKRRVRLGVNRIIIKRQNLRGRRNLNN